MQKILINNEWVAASGPGQIDCINPATEQVFDALGNASAADADKAVRAAHQRFNSGWGRSKGHERAVILRRMAELITQRRDDLARYETLDNGKPLAESYYDIDTAASIYKMYADLAEGLDGPEEDVAQPLDGLRVTVALRPVGVVALITPWNYPIEQFTWKVSAAIAAGCCMVVKPSEYTSLTALMLGQIAIDAGLPAGVLNILTGTGPEVGEALVTHKDVDKVSMTGSTRTGKRVMELAARSLKRVSLELGGKSPILVFDDVDLDRAAEWVTFGIFINQGQVCTATSRLLVQKNIADELVSRIRDNAQRIRIGDGSTEGVQMGPLVNARQYETVTSYIRKGEAEGATLYSGGKRPADLNHGYFIEPTIFTNVTPDMSIWKEEVFGPVLSVMSFDTEEEAIRLANESVYGLAGAVLSADTERTERVADRLDAGITWQNCSQIVVPQAPWGGVKQSGHGRELGRWGLAAFLEPKQKTRWLYDAGIGWYGDGT